MALVRYVVHPVMDYFCVDDDQDTTVVCRCSTLEHAELIAGLLNKHHQSLSAKLPLAGSVWWPEQAHKDGRLVVVTGRPSAKQISWKPIRFRFGELRVVDAFRVCYLSDWVVWATANKAQPWSDSGLQIHLKLSRDNQ